MQESIQKAEDKIIIYETLLDEANEKLEKLRFNKSFLYSLSSEKTKGNLIIEIPKISQEKIKIEVK